MPVYTSSLGTAGFTTGNAASTETPGTWSLKPPITSPTRNIYFERMDVGGMANAATTITGSVIRILSFTTASTGGTAFTPTSVDVTANETATATGVSGQTVSSTGRKQHAIFNFGFAGPGGYVAAAPDKRVVITPNTTTAPSLDAVQVSLAAGVVYSWSFQHSE